MLQSIAEYPTVHLHVPSALQHLLSQAVSSVFVEPRLLHMQANGKNCMFCYHFKVFPHTMAFPRPIIAYYDFFTLSRLCSEFCQCTSKVSFSVQVKYYNTLASQARLYYCTVLRNYIGQTLREILCSIEKKKFWFQ